jgi:hypothetical protein
VKAFQSPPPRIDRADVPLPDLEERLRTLAADQAEAVADVPPGRHLDRLADASAARLRALLAPATTTPEEAS